jgi:hypothetical protein
MAAKQLTYKTRAARRFEAAFDGVNKAVDDILAETERVLYVLFPGPPMVCKNCGALTPPVSVDARENGTLCIRCHILDGADRAAFPSILQSAEDERRRERNQ